LSGPATHVIIFVLLHCFDKDIISNVFHSFFKIDFRTIPFDLYRTQPLAKSKHVGFVRPAGVDVSPLRMAATLEGVEVKVSALKLCAVSV